MPVPGQAGFAGILLDFIFSCCCIWVQDSRCIGYPQRQTSCRELNRKYNGLDFFITKAHLYAKMSFEDELNCLSGGSCHPYYFALRSKEEMQ